MVIRWLVIIFGIIIAVYAANYFILPYFNQSGTIGGPIAVIKEDFPTHGFIGINFEPPNEGSNLVISEVSPGSGAESAGLKRGDVVLSINNTAVNTKFEAYEVVKSTKPNQVIDVEILRNSQNFVVKVKLLSAKKLINLRQQSLQTRE